MGFLIYCNLAITFYGFLYCVSLVKKDSYVRVLSTTQHGTLDSLLFTKTCYTLPQSKVILTLW